MRRLGWPLILLVGILFISAACGGGDDPTATGTAPPATPTQTPTEAVPDDAPSPTSPAEVSSGRYDWEIATVDGNGAKPSLDVDNQDNPHIAFMLEAMPGFVKHSVLRGGVWQTTTVAEGYFYGPLDVKVDDSGMPGIVWHNHDEEDAAYAILTDGTWDRQRIVNPGHDGWDVSLAFDPSGRPHIASIDPAQFGSRSTGVEYASLTDGSWTVEVVGSGPVPYEFGTTIVIDSQGRPHVAWFDEGAQDLMYAVKDGDSWIITTVDEAGDVGRFASLALNSQDLPSISYYESTSDSQGNIKLARWDGSVWDVEQVDSLDNVFLGFFGARKITSLIFDPDDNPILAYSDESVVKVASWNGDEWIIETAATAGQLPWGQQVSLAMDSIGALHLTFAEVTNKGGPGVSGSILYAQGTPKSQPFVSFQDKVTVDLFEVPWVNLGEHSVSLTEVIFDNFDGSFIELNYADQRTVENLRDAIQPIYNPQYGKADALPWLADDDLVIGFTSESDAFAYPISILTTHELVNDTIDGKPILVSYCPLCVSAVVYSRELEGETLLFGNTSALFETDLVMYDHETGSYWFQVLGESIVGDLTGQALTALPSRTMSWREWIDSYPDTYLLAAEDDQLFGSIYDRDFNYEFYAADLDNGLFPFPVSEDKLDGRLRASEIVITAEINSQVVVYPLGRIGDGVVNDQVGGEPVAVLSSGVTGSAFIARANGRDLTFQLSDGQYIDEETGSVWSMGGLALNGPMEGFKLQPAPSRRSFWFSIAGALPEFVLYLPEDLPAG